MTTQKATHEATHSKDNPNPRCIYCGAIPLTRRMTLEVQHYFSDVDAATARLAAVERGCSVNKVLRERLKYDVIRVLRNAGYDLKD